MDLPDETWLQPLLYELDHFRCSTCRNLGHLPQKCPGVQPPKEADKQEEGLVGEQGSPDRLEAADAPLHNLGFDPNEEDTLLEEGALMAQVVTDPKGLDVKDGASEYPQKGTDMPTQNVSPKPWRQLERVMEKGTDIPPPIVGPSRSREGDGDAVLPCPEESGQATLDATLQTPQKKPDVGVEKRVGRPPLKVQREKDSAAQVDLGTQKTLQESFFEGPTLRSGTVAREPLKGEAAEVWKQRRRR